MANAQGYATETVRDELDEPAIHPSAGGTRCPRPARPAPLAVRPAAGAVADAVATDAQPAVTQPPTAAVMARDRRGNWLLR